MALFKFKLIQLQHCVQHGQHKMTLILQYIQRVWKFSAAQIDIGAHVSLLKPTYVSNLCCSALLSIRLPIPGWVIHTTLFIVIALLANYKYLQHLSFIRLYAVPNSMYACLFALNHLPYTSLATNLVTCNSCVIEPINDFLNASLSDQYSWIHSLIIQLPILHNTRGKANAIKLEQFS